MKDFELIGAAIEARERAYAPYSKFKVGAALLTKSGKLYTGCNIENAAFTPTCCAERVALFKAVSDGEREFSAIAVVGGTEGVSECTPCGVCRQALSEFCRDSLRIITSDGRTAKELALGELLPHSFGKNDLGSEK